MSSYGCHSISVVTAHWQPWWDLFCLPLVEGGWKMVIEVHLLSNLICWHIDLDDRGVWAVRLKPGSDVLLSQLFWGFFQTHLTGHCNAFLERCVITHQTRVEYHFLSCPLDLLTFLALVGLADSQDREPQPFYSLIAWCPVPVFQVVHTWPNLGSALEWQWLQLWWHHGCTPWKGVRTSKSYSLFQS